MPVTFPTVSEVQDRMGGDTVINDHIDNLIHRLMTENNPDSAWEDFRAVFEHQLERAKEPHENEEEEGFF